MTITALADNKRVSVSLPTVNGVAVNNNAAAAIGFLVGDVNETRSVTASDISNIKARSGQTTTAANFRSDVNATGAINSADISVSKSRSGSSLAGAGGILPGTIMFVTQVPTMNDFASRASTFGNHRASMDSVVRGGDLMIRYPDGVVRNLTREAGFGMDGMQLANAIAVREPTVHWSGTNPDELAKIIQRLDSKEIKLSMITNRGVKVWPEGFEETFCTDHWRCRFKPTEGNYITKKDIIELLANAVTENIDTIKTENLYAFDGKPAFSLGQGQ